MNITWFDPKSSTESHRRGLPPRAVRHGVLWQSLDGHVYLMDFDAVYLLDDGKLSPIDGTVCDAMFFRPVGTSWQDAEVAGARRLGREHSEEGGERLTPHPIWKEVSSAPYDDSVASAAYDAYDEAYSAAIPWQKGPPTDDQVCALDEVGGLWQRKRDGALLRLLTRDATTLQLQWSHYSVILERSQMEGDEFRPTSNELPVPWSYIDCEPVVRP